MDYETAYEETRMFSVLGMLARLSTAQDPQDLFALAASYLIESSASTEAHALLAVTSDGLARGEYRIRGMWVARPWRGRRVEWSQELDQLPVHAGGFIGSVLRRREPELLTELSLSEDPVIGRDLAEFDSCLVLPLFARGRVSKWLLLFRQGWDEVSTEDLERQILITNLLEYSIDSISAAREVQILVKLLDAQLERLNRMQRRLLPKAMPVVAGAELAAAYQPNGHAGGDYYDFFHLPDGRLVMFLADVCGHEADAAMVMGMLHTIMHANPALEQGPAAAMQHADARLHRSTLEGRFVTAFCAVYDPSTRRLTYTIAGHPVPRLRCGRTGRVGPLGESAASAEEAVDLPLGIADNLVRRECTVALGPGDALVVYTDGFIEAVSPAGKAFETAGLDAAMAEATGGAEDVIREIRSAVCRYTGRETADDDQTLLVLKVAE